MAIIQHAEKETVQIRALHLPKHLHEQIRKDAAAEMRTITAQATYALTKFYETRKGKEGRAQNA